MSTRISLLHPSRSRPQKSFKAVEEWLLHAPNTDVEVIISVDISDPYHNEYAQVYADGFHGEFHNDKWRLIVNDNQNVVQATNQAAKLATGDILVYLSEDFSSFHNWDTAVIKEFEGESRPLLIKVDDMLQPINAPVLTIPIMNRSLYEKLGYFWHPSYASMWVDVDLYYTVRQIGALKNCPHLQFEHKHVSVGKAEMDETYRRSSANWAQGEAVYNKRKRLKFPI